MMLDASMRVIGARQIITFGRQFPHEFWEDSKRLVVATAFDVERHAAQAVPVRTQNLKSSIHTELEEGHGTFLARVGTDVHYGPYVEYGTGLYGPKKKRIRPTRAKVLSWISRGRGRYTPTSSGRRRYVSAAPGRRVFARSVAGMRPRPFMEPALKAGAKTLRRDLRRLVSLAEQRWPRGSR